MPLYLAEKNVELTIVRITGTDKIKKHLENLGFVVGSAVTIINKVDENLIIKIKGVSMALSYELSKRILV